MSAHTRALCLSEDMLMNSKNCCTLTLSTTFSRTYNESLRLRKKEVLHVRYKSLFFFAQIIVMTSRPEGFKFLWNKKSDCNSNEKARFTFIPVRCQICDFLWNKQNKETTLLFGVLMNKISLCSKRPQKFYLSPETFLTPLWVESLWSKLSNHFFSLGNTFSVLISFSLVCAKKKNFQQKSLNRLG